MSEQFRRLVNLTVMLAGAEDHFRAAPPEDAAARARAGSVHGKLSRARSREAVRLLAAGTPPEDIGAHVRAAESPRGSR